MGDRHAHVSWALLCPFVSAADIDAIQHIEQSVHQLMVARLLELHGRAGRVKEQSAFLDWDA